MNILEMDAFLRSGVEGPERKEDPVAAAMRLQLLRPKQRQPDNSNAERAAKWRAQRQALAAAQALSQPALELRLQRKRSNEPGPR